MNKGKFLRLLSITLAFAFLFSVSCQDLKYSKLKANYFFKKANAKFTEEDYKVAAEEYTRVLKIDPSYIPAYYYLASCYQQLYKVGVPLDDKLVTSLTNKMENATDANQLREIVFNLNTLGDESYPEFAEYVKGINLPDTPPAAVTSTKALVSVDPQIAELFKKVEADKAAIAAKKKAEEEAKKKAQQANVISQPGDAQQPADGEKKADEAPAPQPPMNDSTRKLMEKNTIRAMRALGNALVVKYYNTASVDPLLSLGELYNNLSNFDMAERYYLRILDSSYATSKSFFVIAEFYSKYGKDGKTLEYFKKAIDANPDDPDGYLYVANYYMGKQKYDDALTSVQKRIDILEKDPNVDTRKRAEAYYTLGVFSWTKSFKRQMLPDNERKAVVEKGMKALTRAVELDENYPEPYAYINLLYREMIKYDPKNEKTYSAKAQENVEKFQMLYKRLQQRSKLEKELEKK